MSIQAWFHGLYAHWMALSGQAAPYMVKAPGPRTSWAGAPEPTVPQSPAPSLPKSRLRTTSPSESHT